MCPLCAIDISQLHSDMLKLQHDVARISLRIDADASQGQRDRTSVEKCLAQLDEYSANLSLVTKWTKSVGSALPRLVRSLTTINDDGDNSVFVAANGTNNHNNSENHQQPRSAAAAVAIAATNTSSSIAPQKQQQQQQLHLSEVLNTSSNAANAATTMVPLSEVRAMFSSFRDELVRLRERNDVLEQRLSDAVCQFEGSSVAKLKAEVEGRLRTMLHSLHEAMNGTSSPMAELAQGVAFLRTEVEMMRGKMDAITSWRGAIEARLGDAGAKLKELSDAASRRGAGEQAAVAAQQQEMRELRAALKELSATMSHRLETERSAREFDAGDIRHQLRVLLRSPSPLARLHDPTSPSPATSSGGAMITASAA